LNILKSRPLKLLLSMFNNGPRWWVFLDPTHYVIVLWIWVVKGIWGLFYNLYMHYVRRLEESLIDWRNPNYNDEYLGMLLVHSHFSLHCIEETIIVIFLQICFYVCIWFHVLMSPFFSSIAIFLLKFYILIIRSDWLSFFSF
jgi:hypothetical protein